MGYSWPGVFLLGASGRTARFFTQLLFLNAIKIYFSLRSSFLELYVTWTVYYVSMIWNVSFSLYVNKPSAWLEASHKLRFRGERCFSILEGLSKILHGSGSGSGTYSANSMMYPIQISRA